MERQDRRRGFGWIPDLPDHRDKRFHRACEKLKLAGKPRGQAATMPRAKRDAEGGGPDHYDRHVFDGWRMSESGMDRRLTAAESAGDVAFADRLRASLLKAFPAEERAVKNGTKRSPLASAPPDESAELPTRVDLRPFMSPIENQGDIGSCTAQSVAGLVEYLQIATRAAYVDSSRLFLYKATRNLYRSDGDTGAHIRDAIKALRLFGVCPEFYWPYEESQFDHEPPAFCYAYASNYQAMRYYRLDTIQEIWRSLAQGYPVVLGFTVFESIWSDDNKGLIPYPGRYEKSDGGHAVLAVGYYDHGFAGRGEPDEKRDGGYLIIRNSWGTDWGRDGYGFLPYRYVQGWSGQHREDPLSDDYWTMTQMELPDLGDTKAAPFLLRGE